MEALRQAWVETPEAPVSLPPRERRVTGKPIAGYGYRVAGYLFDVGLAVAAGVLAVVLSGGRDSWQSGAGETVFIVTTVGVWLLATTVAMGVFKGQTLGKKLVGTRVIGPAGAAGFGTSVLRDQIARLLYFVPFFALADAVWAAADGDKQSLRDKMVGSYVVRERGTAGRAWAVSAAAVALLAAWVVGTSMLDAGSGSRSGEGYTKAERTGFVDSCAEGGMSRRRCDCMFSYISARVSHDEFSSVHSDDMRDWPRHLQRVSRAAIRACAGGGGEEPSTPANSPA
jgi:uncharacterized RDD family membrane protein YckC